MSAEPPGAGDKLVIYTTNCPVDTCPFVAVTEESQPGIDELTEHVNQEHEPWEMPDEDVSHLIEDADKRGGAE